MRGATVAADPSVAVDPNFNPRPPCGGRRASLCHVVKCGQFQSTPPMRGATVLIRASIFCRFISIHAPHAGGDLSLRDVIRLPILFQSTPPMRGATPITRPHSAYFIISIHAPHAGGDAEGLVYPDFSVEFQSTPPMRGATESLKSSLGSSPISIHAPHAGGDAPPQDQ